MYCTCLAVPLAARSLRPLPVSLRSFSPAAVGVLLVRSRRRLHRLWAGSKIPPPGNGACNILRHHLLRHVHRLGASGGKRVLIAQIKLTRIYTQKYVKISQNGRAYYFKGIKLRRLISKISTGCS